MPTQYYSGWNYRFPQFHSAPWLGTDSTGKVTNLGQTGATAAYVLTANGVGSAPSWQAVPTSTVVLTGDSGGALTSHSFTLTGDATGLTIAGSGTTFSLGGKLGIANGGTNAITFTTNMPVYYNGTSIVSSNIGVVAYVEVSGTSQAMAINTEYCPQNEALTTLTLPSTAVVGSTLKVTGKGAGGWKIAQNASQFINFLGAVTTTGATGYLQGVNQYACIELRCTTADNGWVVVNVNGNITVA